MFRIFILLSAFVLFSCASTSDNGGACTYDIDTIPATIIRIDTNASRYPDIVLTAKNHAGGLDTLRFGYMTNENLTMEEIQQRGYTIGSQLECEHKVRTSGHCNPEIFVLRTTFFK